MGTASWDDAGSIDLDGMGTGPQADGDEAVPLSTRPTQPPQLGPPRIDDSLPPDITSCIPELSNALEFRRAIESASLDNGDMSPEQLERLRNPTPLSKHLTKTPDDPLNFFYPPSMQPTQFMKTFAWISWKTTPIGTSSLLMGSRKRWLD